MALEVDAELESDEIEDPISDEDVVYQINTFGADYTIDGLIKRFDRGDIFRPSFQRNFVWTHAQASKFIESILLGLPIPSIFLYREESTQQQLIVDGLQRLTTLHSFSKGRFSHNDRVFKLRDVKKRFEGCTIDDLEPEDVRRFEDSIIHAMIIQQLAPDDNNSSVFHIFERLNSYGTPLQPQEMRAAIYNGSFQDLLEALNQNTCWREIFGAIHRRCKDQELILRFLALHFWKDRYMKPMKGFLNDFMQENRHITADVAMRWTDLFETTIYRAHEALGKAAFRPQRPMNVAVYDAVMVAISLCPQAAAETISAAYKRLIADDRFMKMSSDGTSDESTVHGRINMAIEHLHAAD